MSEAVVGMYDVTLRAEAPADHAAVRALVVAAFGATEEADLIEALRAQALPLVSIVATVATGVVGHVMCSPVRLETRPELRLMGLAPMAVAPPWQRQGIGLALARAAIDACAAIGIDGIVVLGHPGYYPRAGFVTASHFGLRCPYDAPDEAFMALELVPGALAGAHGTVAYHPAFPEA